MNSIKRPPLVLRAGQIVHGHGSAMTVNLAHPPRLVFQSSAASSTGSSASPWPSAPALARSAPSSAALSGPASGSATRGSRGCPSGSSSSRSRPRRPPSSRARWPSAAASSRTCATAPSFPVRRWTAEGPEGPAGPEGRGGRRRKETRLEAPRSAAKRPRERG